MTWSGTILSFLQPDSSWLSDGLAWTVVQPVTGRLSPLETAARLTGGGRPLPAAELDVEEVSERGAVLLGQVVDGAMIVEPQGFSLTVSPRILERLSQRAQVWHVSWNITGNSRMIHAANGRVLAEIPHLEPASAYGADLGSVGPELELLAAALDAPWPASKATALAIVEARTEARLDAGLGRRHPAALVDKPVAADLPPVGFAREPDLDAAVHRAPSGSGARSCCSSPRRRRPAPGWICPKSPAPCARPGRAARRSRRTGGRRPREPGTSMGGHAVRRTGAGPGRVDPLRGRQRDPPHPAGARRGRHLPRRPDLRHVRPRSGLARHGGTRPRPGPNRLNH